MSDGDLTEHVPVARAELLRRIGLVVDAECGGSAAVLASRVGLCPEAAVQLREGDVHALTVERLLAILRAFPAHAHWLISGENVRQ